MNKEESKEIDWGKFSSDYSLKGLKAGLELLDWWNSDIEELADWVHVYWVQGLKALWKALENGYSVKGGYSEEKRRVYRRREEGVLLYYIRMTLMN